MAMEKEGANYQIFNVGSGKAITVLEIAERLIAATKKSMKPKVTNKFRKGDIRHCFADIGKIKKSLGFQPKVNLKEGIEELVDWSRSVEAKDFFAQATKKLKDKNLI